MTRRSAGILLVRPGPAGPEVLLAHPGGPFWAKRDAGAWSIPKGEIGEGEEPEAAARREWSEEIGRPPPDGPLVPLGQVIQRGGKLVVAFALMGDVSDGSVSGNTVDVEWPPRSGRRVTVPEIDRIAWFGLDEAARRINPAQAAFLGRLPPDWTSPLPG